MLNNKQLLEVLDIVKEYNTPEVKEIKHTAIRLLSGVNDTTREVEESALLYQVHELLDL